jgi:hypothetical protein
MKAIITLKLAFLIVTFSLKAQLTDTCKLVFTLKQSFDFFTVDQVGNFYVVSNHALTKYNAKGLKIAEYQNNARGRISSIDVTDPMRPLVFYKEFNQLVFLDVFLAELRAPVKLDELGCEQISMVCSSKNGGFWLYDAVNNQIKNYDGRLDLGFQSVRLSSVFDIQSEPVFLKEQSLNLFLGCGEDGIMVFNEYAAYLRTLPVNISSNVLIEDNFIFYFNKDKDSIVKYSLKTYDEQFLPIPDIIIETQPRHIILKSRQLYVLTSEAFSIYQCD